MNQRTDETAWTARPTRHDALPSAAAPSSIARLIRIGLRLSCRSAIVTDDELECVGALAGMAPRLPAVDAQAAARVRKPDGRSAAPASAASRRHRLERRRSGPAAGAVGPGDRHAGGQRDRCRPSGPGRPRALPWRRGAPGPLLFGGTASTPRFIRVLGRQPWSRSETRELLTHIPGADAEPVQLRPGCPSSHRHSGSAGRLPCPRNRVPSPGQPCAEPSTWPGWRSPPRCPPGRTQLFDGERHPRTWAVDRASRFWSSIGVEALGRVVADPGIHSVPAVPARS